MLWRARRRWSTSQLFWRPVEHVHHPSLRACHPSVAPASIPRTKHTSVNAGSRRAGGVSAGDRRLLEKEGPTHVAGHSPAGPVQGANERRELLNTIDEIYVAGTSQSQAASLLARIRGRPPWVAVLTDAERVCGWAEDLARSNSPYRAQRVLQIALEVGAQFKQNVYERVAFRLAEAKEWHLIPPLVALGKRKTGRSTVRLLNWRTKALVETQHFTFLDGMLEEFSEFGLRPQRRTFHLIVQGHLLNHDIGRASETIQEMERAGFPVETSAFAAIISVYKGLGPDKFIEDRAFEMLTHLDATISTSILNGLITLYLDKHDVNGALRLLDVSKPSPPNAIQNHHLSVEVKTKICGVTNASVADRTTYLSLINYFAKHQELPKMHLVLRKMAEAEICPDGRIAAALVRAYFASGHEHLALSVVLDACSTSPLDLKLLNRIGCRQEVTAPVCGPYEGGPSNDLFNSLLEGLLPRKGLKVVPTILRLMHSLGLSPDATTLAILLTYVERTRHVRPQDVIRVLKPLLSYKVRPTLRHLNTILHSIVRSQRSLVRKEGWDALGALVRRKTVAPRVKTDALAGSSSSSSFDPNLDITLPRSQSFQALFQPILESLSSRSIKADRATFALRMRFETFARARGEDAAASAARVLQQMKERGLHPNAYHYAALAEAHCASGDMRAAHAVLHEADARGVLTNNASRLVLHTVLISGYARTGRPGQGLRVFQEMLKADVVPDVAAVHAVVGGFFAVQAFKVARRLLLELWPLVGPLPAGDLRKVSMKELTALLRDVRNGRVAGSRYNPTSEHRQVLRRRISKIIVQWQAMSYKKDVLYPRTRLRIAGRVRRLSVASNVPRTSHWVQEKSSGGMQVVGGI